MAHTSHIVGGNPAPSRTTWGDDVAKRDVWMPNDAKLGLVIGVAMVVVIALVYFRKDQIQESNSSTKVVAGQTTSFVKGAQ